MLIVNSIQEWRSTILLGIEPRATWHSFGHACIKKKKKPDVMVTKVALIVDLQWRRTSISLTLSQGLPGRKLQRDIVVETMTCTRTRRTGTPSSWKNCAGSRPRMRASNKESPDITATKVTPIVNVLWRNGEFFCAGDRARGHPGWNYHSL